MRWPFIRLLPKVFHFDFVGYAKYAAIISAVAIIGSGVSFATKGLNFGIDFLGGTMIEVSTPGPAPLAGLRASLPAFGARDPQVQGIGGPNTAMVRFRTEGDPKVTIARVEEGLTAKYPGIKFQPATVVGPKVSGELLTSGFMALGVALVLMLAYIWFRFQLQFGLGAVVAVFHDILLTLGLLSVMHIEFSMTSIAALLTVIGYSMNEKVITFDRLRENLRKYKRHAAARRDQSVGERAAVAHPDHRHHGDPGAQRRHLPRRPGAVPPGLHHGVRHLRRHLFVDLRRPADHPAVGRQARRRRAGTAEEGRERHGLRSWPANAPSIDAYGGGGFRLDGVRHDGSLLILADEARAWPVASMADLTMESLKPVFDAGRQDVEFLLLGVGARNAQPPRVIRERLLAAGMGLEFMDTPAAAKLYNVLTSEGRRLAAALIAV
jgi:preprotein translocase subunit SecF